MQNCREKGGTGKLRSYWEESIFEVVEKRADAPVYRIRNIHKEKDVRVVHRNLLMQCNQLPEDVFRNLPEKKKNNKKKIIAGRKEKVAVVEGESSESEDELNGVVVEIPVGVVPGDSQNFVGEEEEGVGVESDLETGHGEDTLDTGNVILDVAEREAEDDTQADLDDTNEHESRSLSESEVEMSAGNGDLSEEPSVDAESSDNASVVEENSPSDHSSDDEDQPTVRPRSSRRKKPRERLTYDELGGNPVRRAVQPLSKIQQNLIHIAGYSA